MSFHIKYFIFCTSFVLGSASYHEQYKVPFVTTDRWESYIFNDREFIIQNLPVTWENAKILCRGHHNATLAILDTKDKAEFLAEALAESQFVIDSVWVGARRLSAEDPAGYRWPTGLELRRTSLDVAQDESHAVDKYPAWLNRTHVPVPDSGADCVALERVSHDNPVFLDLPCMLDRAFVCERDAVFHTEVAQVRSVRCRTGLYQVYDGRMDWNQAAAYCILQKMSLANVATMRCLKKIGMTMLKSRPSIEAAWIGGRGALGRWTWVDTGLSILTPNTLTDTPDVWPPLRDRNNIKQSGCLQIDRHTSHPPVFMEARCERKMQFICYQGVQSLGTTTPVPSDDLYSYVLVRQQFYWQHAYDNCLKMNGRLASIDNKEMMVQLLLVMGENKDEPVNHVWVSGRLNMTKDPNVETVSFAWYNPASGKRIADPKNFADSSAGLYTPPWLDDEFTMDSPCLNLDRQDHLSGLVYGLPCDTAQNSICMIEKSIKLPATESTNDAFEGA